MTTKKTGNNWLRRFAQTALISACVGLSPSAFSQQLEKITYLLPAPATLPAFAPWVLAQHKGYYKEENIDIEFVAARGGLDVAKQIGVGNALIGGAIGDTPIIARANDIPIKAVAILGNGSLAMVATHKKDNIQHIGQLEKKTVTTIAYADTTFYAFLGSLRKANLGRSDVEIQAAGPTGVWQLFVAGKSSAMAAVPDWVAMAEAQGSEVHLLPKEEIFDSLPQAILASDKTIKENPELIKRLVRATLRGMNDIMTNPDAALEDYIAAVPSAKENKDTLARTFALYNQYVYAGQKELGGLDMNRLEAVQNFYIDEGIVSKKSELTDLYDGQFTLTIE